MSGHWTYLTPIAIMWITAIMALFLIRFWIERQNQQQKKMSITKKEVVRR
ncbi:hypothetical protein [Nostoc sp. PCC 9305]